MLYTMTWLDDVVTCEIVAADIETIRRLHFRLTKLKFVSNLHVWILGHEIDPYTENAVS